MVKEGIGMLDFLLVLLGALAVVGSAVLAGAALIALSAVGVK